MSLDLTQSVELPRAIEERLRPLPRSARTLYFCLRNNDNGGQFSMTVPALTEETGLARRTILDASPADGGRPDRHRERYRRKNQPVPDHQV